jgi:hypothetical protein
MNDAIATQIANRLASMEMALNTIAAALQDLVAHGKTQQSPVQQVQARRRP